MVHTTRTSLGGSGAAAAQRVSRRGSTALSAPSEGAAVKMGRVVQGLGARVKRTLHMRKDTNSRGAEESVDGSDTSSAKMPIRENETMTHAQEIMRKFRHAVYKIKRASKMSANSSMIQTPNCSFSSVGSSRSGEDYGVVKPKLIPDSDDPVMHPTAVESRVSSWLRDTERDILGISPVELNESSSQKERMNSGESKTSCTGSVLEFESASATGQSSISRCSSPVEGAAQAPRRARSATEGITTVLARQRGEVLQSISLVRDRIRVAQRQVDFLSAQLAAMQAESSDDEQHFAAAVDGLDQATLRAQRLGHQLEQLEAEREVLKRKVLASRSASRACGGEGPWDRTDGWMEGAREELTRLAYAGLLKERT